MATATSNSQQPARFSKRRVAALLLVALAAMALVWTAMNFGMLKGNASLGSGYMAHVTCSCRYVEGRSLEDCAKDNEEGTEIVSISDDPDNKRITASVPFLATAMAEKRGAYGCLQLTDDEIKRLD